MLHELNKRKLYILSGLPGSGKTFITKKFSNEMIISTDDIRKSFIRSKKFLSSDNEVKEFISSQSDNEVFKIVSMILELKMKEKLTTVIDATNISDVERKRYINIAEKHGVEAEILIMDTSYEDCLINDQNREKHVGEKVLSKFYEKFQRDSKYPFRLINNKDTIVLKEPFRIPSDIKLDVVGDIHGLYDDLIILLSSQGYAINDFNISHTDPKRKLLFLGDFVDRGTQSLEVLRLIKSAVESGHYAIRGNHEDKLLKNMTRDEVRGSFAVLSTYSQVMKCSKEEQDSITSFLKSLDGYYIQNECVYTHANISNFTNETPLSEFMYGTYPRENKDTDEEYQKLYDKNVNKYVLIRGHIAQQSVQDNVYSLEFGQAYAGSLALLKSYECDGFNYSELYKNTVFHKVSFNFDEYLKNNNILYGVNKLVDAKLATVKDYGLLKVVKYSKSVFYKNLWNEGGELLLKSRGLVLDVAGNIIQHSFDKVFNYRENDSGLDIRDDEVVQYVEKRNGFLGNITLNPYTKELLCSTTGSLDSDFVDYIKYFIDGKLNYLLKKYLSENDVTLSFEVVHPDDPHIIVEDIGLYLIGVRGKNYNDKNWQEKDVDEVAKIFGFVRPAHGLDTFANVRDDMIPNCQHEGFMIRRLNSETDEYDLALKFKSPFYLTTKFIGRLSSGKVKFMFSNPEKFKQSLDEEFFPIVDLIVNNISMEDFLSMDNNKSVSFVRDLILNYQAGK